MSGSNSSSPGAAPASRPEPVGLTVHGVAVPDASRAPGRTSGRLKALLVLLACAAPVIASYFTYYVVRPDARSNYGTLIQPVRELPPALALARLDGASVAAASLRGQWLLVVVADASCDAACEQRLYLQRQLREMLGKERDRVDKVWFVTGSAAVRPELAEAMRASDVQVLRTDAAALSAWLAPEAGRRLDEHLYIVDPMGNWMMRAPLTPEPARLKRDLDRLLRASSSWDQPGR